MAKKHNLFADDNWFDVLLYNAMKIFWKMRRDFEECFKYFDFDFHFSEYVLLFSKHERKSYKLFNELSL